MAEKNTGGPSSGHKLPRVSTPVLHSIIYSPLHGYCDALFERIILESFRFCSVRSGNVMTTCCAVKANMDSGDSGNQNCMAKHGSSYSQIVY